MRSSLLEYVPSVPEPSLIRIALDATASHISPHSCSLLPMRSLLLEVVKRPSYRASLYLYKLDGGVLYFGRLAISMIRVVAATNESKSSSMHSSRMSSNIVIDWNLESRKATKTVYVLIQSSLMNGVTSQ